MAGFVENVNKVAQGLTPTFAANVETVAENILDVNAVAADIVGVAIVADNINAVVAVGPLAPELTTVTTNITEILAADDNAAIATTQAGIATTQATAAADSAASAATAKTDADNAALAAAASATTATTKASEASTSATNAANSAASATTSASTATTKAGEASASASSAATSANTVTTKANEASASAISAGNSATSASTSASNAAASASTATTKAAEASASAGTATTQAGIATTAATQASASASNAASSLASVQAIFDNFDDIYLGAKANDPTLDNDGNPLTAGQIYWNTAEQEVRFYNGTAWERPEYSASQSAVNAATSATSAGNSATSAAASATTATTKANEAAASAVSANTFASNAANSATSAGTSATSAANSASAANTSATAAANSATLADASANAAASSATEAASLLDQFDDRYLGAKAGDPSVDNDGNSLLVGALYYNTVSNSLKLWTGTVWNPAAFDVGGNLVTSFNTRIGDITLSSGDVTTALGFTPEPADATIVKEATVDVLTNKTLDDVSNLVGADHVHYRVRNSTGSTINIGTVVRASATQPGTDYILIEPVTDPQTQVAIGIVHQTLVNNAIGLVINTGVQTDFNTSAWAVGTILYPNTTGGFTSTKPTSGQYQACAYVLRQHSSSGTLLCEFTEPKLIASTTQAGYVQLNDTLTSTSSTQALTAAQGKELNDRLVTVENSTVTTLDSLTDVTITTPSSGQVLSFNGSAWVNSSPTGGASSIETVEKTAGYTIDVSDKGKHFRFALSAASTLNLPDVATAGNGFYVYLTNNSALSTRTLTIDPSGSELVSGKSTVVLNPSESCILVCTGSDWERIGKANALAITASDSSTPAAATGEYSLAYGSTASVTGTNSIALGRNVQVGGASSMGVLNYAYAQTANKFVTGNDQNTSVGQTQSGIQTWRAQTKVSTPSVTTLTSSSVGFLLTNGQSYGFTALIVGNIADTAGIMFEVKGLIRRDANASATYLVGTPTVTQLFSDASLTSCSVSVGVNTTYGAMTLTINGTATDTINWTTVVYSAEVKA